MDISAMLRHAARRLIRDRGFTCAAVVALGLGIGGANTIFTLTNGLFLRGLPSPHPEQIVAINIADRRNPNQPVSAAEFDEWARESRNFSYLTANATRNMVLADERRSPERFIGAYSSASTFRMLAEPPLLGRDFTAADDRPGAPVVAILSYTTWQNRYAGDARVIGRPVTVNGVPATVVGVMRNGFRYPTSVEMWLPLAALPDVTARPNDRLLNVVGRITDARSAPQAAAELSALVGRRSARTTSDDRGTHAVVQGFTDRTLGTPVALIMTALMIAVGLLLLISCANVANLLLARGATRRREVAIRSALGASRRAIVVQLLAESLLLAAAAGVFGLFVSMLGVGAFDAATSRLVGRPYWFDFSVDGRILLFLGLLSLSTVVVFGLVPAFRTARIGTVEGLTERSGTDSTPRRWTDALVVAELALTLALLTGAALMTRTVLAMQDVGFETAPLGTMQLVLPDHRYGTPDARNDFIRTLEDRLAASPAIASAAASTSLPAYGALTHDLTLDGRAPVRGRPLFVDVIKVGPRYFETMGLPLRRGRPFTAAEGGDGSPVVVVNEAFAARHLPSVDPIGHQVMLTQRDTRIGWATIVGVVPTVRQRTYEDPGPLVYVPYRLRPEPITGLIVRSRGDVGAALATARETVRALDPDVTVFGVRSMDDSLGDVMFLGPLFGSIFASFAMVALVLCTTGLYAVTAYSVSRRRREIGVRVALGAQTRQVWWLVMRRTMIQIGIGVPLGLVGAFGMSRLLHRALSAAQAENPATIAMTTLLLIAVMVAACLVPAHRAARLNPIAALRAE